MARRHVIALRAVSGRAPWVASFGSKASIGRLTVEVRFGSDAHVKLVTRHVRFVPEAEITPQPIDRVQPIDGVQPVGDLVPHPAAEPRARVLVFLKATCRKAISRLLGRGTPPPCPAGVLSRRRLVPGRTPERNDCSARFLKSRPKW
jgi:hypothetical protein